MDWVTTALVSAALFGMVTVGDKRLLDAYFPSVASFNFMVGMAQAASGLVVLAVVLPLLGMPSLETAMLGLSAGALWAVGLSFFFFGLRMEEVSRVTPIYSTFPIFTALLALTFLSERLSAVQWSAMVVVVVGTGLISVRSSPGRREFISTKALLLVLVGAIITGAAFVVNKEALGDGEFWTVYGLRAMGLSAGFMVFSYRPTLASDVLTAMRNPQARNLYLTIELLLATTAVILQQVAIKLGPVSLVSALSGARPLFVLGLTVLLSTRFWNVLNEPLDWNTVALKVIATALIVGGIVGLTVA